MLADLYFIQKGKSLLNRISSPNTIFCLERGHPVEAIIYANSFISIKRVQHPDFYSFRMPFR